MMKEFSYGNIMEVLRIQKIVLNVGLGEAIQNIKLLDAAKKLHDYRTKAVVTRPRSR
jgi:large subunit ribosomal protein L5